MGRKESNQTKSLLPNFPWWEKSLLLTVRAQLEPWSPDSNPNCFPLWSYTWKKLMIFSSFFFFLGGGGDQKTFLSNTQHAELMLRSSTYGKWQCAGVIWLLTSRLLVPFCRSGLILCFNVLLIGNKGRDIGLSGRGSGIMPLLVSLMFLLIEIWEYDACCRCN